MVDSRISHLIVGYLLGMEFEDVSEDNSLGRKYSYWLLWYISLSLPLVVTDIQIFQSFDIRPHNPDYKLQIKHTITIKPKDFHMHASPRQGRDINQIIGVGAEKSVNKESGGMGDTKGSTGKIDLSVFYGTSIIVLG